MIPTEVSIWFDVFGWLNPNCMSYADGVLVAAGEWPEQSREVAKRARCPAESSWDEFLRICAVMDVWSWPSDVSNRGTALHRGYEAATWILSIIAEPKRVWSSGCLPTCPPGTFNKLMFIYCELMIMTGLEPPEPFMAQRFVPSNLAPAQSR